jgi:hypothetical protein
MAWCCSCCCLAAGPPVNQNPVATADSFSITVLPGTTYQVPNILANDADPDGDPLAISQVSPVNPLTTLLGATVTRTGNQLQYNVPTSGLSFPGIGGRYADSFTYTVTDGNGGSATATVTVFCECPWRKQQAGLNGSSDTSTVEFSS